MVMGAAIHLKINQLRDAIKPMLYSVKEIRQSLFQVHNMDSEVDRGVACAPKARQHSVQTIAPADFTKLAPIAFRSLASSCSISSAGHKWSLFRQDSLWSFI
jgi:hypothetical protein